MKRLLTIFLLLSCFITNGQTTFNTKYKTGWSTDSCNARVTLPAGYPYNTADSVQAIVCFLGLGEVGSDTSKLTLYGPHSYIKGGWNGGVQLQNGTHYPILITIQEPAAYYKPYYYDRVIDTILARYKILRNSLHFTGYSMGGWTSNSFNMYRASPTDSTHSFIVKSTVNIEGVLPDDCIDATPCPYPAGFPQVARNGGHGTNGYGWEFEQSNDNRNIQSITTAMNGAVAGTSQYVQTFFGSGGHGSFEQWYGSPTNVPHIWAGFHPTTTGQTIYQWMLRQGDTVHDLHSGNSPPSVNAGGNQNITLPTSSITVSGTATGNGGASIVSTLWTQDSGPNTASITSASSLSTTITGLIQGTYVFRLTATDNNSLSAFSTMNCVVNGAGGGPTASAGGPYVVTQGSYNGFLVLQGVATGSNLKYMWTFPCQCYTGNDNSTQTSYTGGDPRVAKIVAPTQLNAQVIQMKLNGGDSIHRYNFVLTVTDSVTGQTAVSTALVIYRYWNKYPPQNTDGSAGGHYCTFSDSVNYIGPAAWLGHDWVIMGGNNDPVNNASGSQVFTSIYDYYTFADSIHVVPGATKPVHVWINPGPYFNIHMEADTVGGIGWQPQGDTTKAQIIIAPFPNHGRLTQQAGAQFINWINTRVTGVYDTALHLGDSRYQGAQNGYAYTDTMYDWGTDDCWRSRAGHGWQLEGKDTQWPEIDHLSSTRGNFGGFTLKAEYSLMLNPNTRPQVYWNGGRIHDNFVSAATGEDYYIGSANNPGTWLRNWWVWNNRAVLSGNKLLKFIDEYSGCRQFNNVGAFGSINFPSPFEYDISFGNEVEFINTGNLNTHNIFYGFGNQGLNLLLQKFGGPNPTDTNKIISNLYYGSVGNETVFIGQEDSAFNTRADSNYLGGAINFLMGRIYNAPRGTNTNYQVYQTTAGGVPPQATRALTIFRYTTYDSTKDTLTSPLSDARFTGSTGNTLISALAIPQFKNTGFNGQFPIQWVDTIYSMWGDEYKVNDGVAKQGTPMYYDSGQVVMWFDKFYRSKINNNIGHPPAGVTDAYWTLITFSNGGTTPPNDLSLPTTDPYYQKGMGLLPQNIISNPNCNCLICANCVFQ